jgi:autotransporter-associated beta strand protein
MNKTRIFLTPVLLTLTIVSARAGSATWKPNPGSSHWNTATNWTPETVPNGPSDIATFGISSTTGISFVDNVEVDSIIFDVGASAYALQTDNSTILTLSGVGIINNSGVIQNILIPGGAQSLILQNSASLGSNVAVTNNNAGGYIIFEDHSSAPDVTFTNNSNIFFQDSASAGRSTFINNPGPSTTYFGYVGNDGADNATFINIGANQSGQLGGATFLYSAGDFGRSTIINYGGTVSGAGGGYTECNFLAHVDDVTFIGYGGTNGGDGGNIQLYGVTATNARVQIYGNSILDISFGGTTTTIGSLEGEGTVILGRNRLVVTGDRNTIFSGVIKNAGGIGGGSGGGLMKSGTGRLVLRRGSSYKGDTIITGGELAVHNRAGSGTGPGLVQVNTGILSGTGIISGAVTAGAGSGPGAQVVSGRNGRGILTLSSSLLFNSDATYVESVDSDAVAATSVVANGVAINEGAQFSLIRLGGGILDEGTVFKVIDNSSPNPISGTFVNLADGAIITVGSDNFQASYSGGDGNDLILTVVP